MVAVSKRKVDKVFRTIPTVLWGLILLCIGFSLLSRDFLSLRNFVNILQQGSFLVILCMGVVVVKIMGGIELSVGGVMSLAGMVMAHSIVNMGFSVLLGVVSGLAVGFVCGMLNGIIIDKMNVPSFVATLGMQYITVSLALVLNNGGVIWGLPDKVALIGRSTILGIPSAIIVLILAVIISSVVLRLTVLGSYFYAVGGNEEALALSGKKSWLFKIIGYAYCGLFAGLAGVVMTFRMESAQPTVGIGMEFEAFSACVLGGAIMAGKGTVFGALIGALFIVVLRSGLNNIGISTFYQLAIVGIAIILSIVVAVFFDKRLEGQV